MKKICFMLACLLLISNTPSFAMKIIVNDTNSRIVPSRSTSHYESDLDAAYHAQKGQAQVEEEQSFEEHQQEELNEEFANEEHNEEFNEEVANEENPEEFIEENNEEPVTYVRKNLTEEEINNLSEDFRNELIGTYWNYAELEAQRAYEQQLAMEEEQRMHEEQRAMEEEQVQEAQPEEIVEEPMPEEIAEEPVQEEIADINDEFNEYMMKKRGSREAADYYMIDSIKDPNVAIPSGYPQ